MPRKSALLEAYNNLPVEEGRSWRSGEVSLETLKAILDSSALQKVQVSAEVFGLVDIDVNRVKRQLEDKYFIKQLERITQRHELPCVVHISIHEAFVKTRRRYDPRTGLYESRDRSERPTKYSLSIFWFGVRKDGYIYHAS